MNVHKKARISALAGDIVRLADKFSALGSQPDLPTFTGLVRDLATEVEPIEEDDKKSAKRPSRAIEMALTGYLVNGAAPDLDWFVPAVREFAADVLDGLPEKVTR